MIWQNYFIKLRTTYLLIGNYSFHKPAISTELEHKKRPLVFTDGLLFFMVDD